MKILFFILSLSAVVVSAAHTAESFIKQNEGFKSKVYTCSAGKKTIGYGFTHPSLIARGKMTEAEADAALRWYISNYRNVLKKYVKVTLTANQEAVLLDFIHHFGEYNFRTSTLLKKLNKGNYNGIPYELSRWVYQTKVDKNGRPVRDAKGRIIKVKSEGLVNRANRRIELWERI